MKQQCVSNKFIANNAGKGCQGFYIKQDRWGIEQDSGETKRESVCVRDSA